MSEKKMPQRRSCGFCGTAFQARTGPGRPRAFCSEKCREAEKRFQRVEAILVEMSPGNEVASKIRRRCWLMGNLVSTTQGEPEAEPAARP